MFGVVAGWLFPEWNRGKWLNIPLSLAAWCKQDALTLHEILLFFGEQLLLENYNAKSLSSKKPKGKNESCLKGPQCVALGLLRVALCTR